MLFYLRIFHFMGTAPLFAALNLIHFTAVAVKEFRQLVTINPDLIVPFLLGLIENKLQSPVQVNRLDIVDVFLRAVPGMPHVTDHIARRYHAAFLEVFCVWIVLAQMRVIIIPPAIEASDTNAPAAVLIPAKRLHDA